MTFSPSITAQPGRDLLFKVSDGTSPTTYVTVGGVRTNNVTINNNPVDITNALSAGWREFLADGGVQSLSMSVDGIFDSKTTGADILNSAAINRTTIEAQLISGHGDQFLGNFVVVSFNRTGAFDNAETFSATIESSGAILYIAGS